MFWTALNSFVRYEFSITSTRSFQKIVGIIEGEGSQEYGLQMVHLIFEVKALQLLFYYVDKIV